MGRDCKKGVAGSRRQTVPGHSNTVRLAETDSIYMIHPNTPQSKTRLYHIWSGMKQRCGNPNAEGYENYGGRGITVCPEWLHNFQVFEDWAYSHGYREYLTIDRIDNGRGYSPDNCRWATRLEQAHNRRSCVGNPRLYEINGIFKTSSEWAAIAGISRKRFNKRWAAGKRGTALLAPIPKKH